MENRVTAEEIRAMNELQRKYFNRSVDIFEPPLPRGVPKRLKAIVQAGAIRWNEKVLDVGTGTGILIPYINRYGPAEVHACDLAEKMLTRVKKKYPSVITHLSDIRDLDLPADSIDVAFINGCFSNIMDKERSLDNLNRLLRHGGRLVISHPLGRNFIVELKQLAPFPLDLLPDAHAAKQLLESHGFVITTFRDEAELYLIVAKSEKATERL